MFKLFSTVLLVLYCAAFVAAQSADTPRAEFFAGYSLLRTDYRAEDPIPSEPVGVLFDGRQTLNGFNVSVGGSLSEEFSLVGDFSGHFTKDGLTTSTGNQVDTTVRIFNVLGGPQYKFHNDSRLAPFVRGLAGVANTRAKVTGSNPSTTDIGSSTDFALALGGGLDVRMNDRVDVRLIQVDYNPIFVGEGSGLGYNRRADNVRLSFGVVFK